MAAALEGLRVIEFEGMGPGPFCGMMLADHGADVVRIVRPARNASEMPLPAGRYDVLGRGRRTLSLDLKDPASIESCLQLFQKSDAILEGFRPGVMERLGLGPDVALQRNPRLAYARMTGWGQTGPRATQAGHDINYIAISGALHAIGPRDKPVPPLNLVGDFGGGGMFMAFGILAAVLHARATGVGQVVDCAMSDSAAVLMSAIWGAFGSGEWRDTRSANILDGAAPFYDTYCCGDGKWVAVGAIEPAFYQLLLKKLGLEDSQMAIWRDRQRWPKLKEDIAVAFAARPRADWDIIFGDLDACYAPVLSLEEAPFDPHNLARGTFVKIDGVTQPEAAPKFSKTPGIAKGNVKAVTVSDLISDWSAEGMFPRFGEGR